jgi:hypothetical protein
VHFPLQLLCVVQGDLLTMLDRQGPEFAHSGLRPGGSIFRPSRRFRFVEFELGAHYWRLTSHTGAPNRVHVQGLFTEPWPHPEWRAKLLTRLDLDERDVVFPTLKDLMGFPRLEGP